MAERELFGTDGVRGAVGEFLTADLAMRLGRAAALAVEPERPQVADRPRHPRVRADARGRARGRNRLGRRRRDDSAGVLPTPAASILARRLDFDLAAVVSASHNPYGDNGIKFFDRRGIKLDDEVEAEIERRLDDDGAEHAGSVTELEGAFDDYMRELRSAFPLDLSGPPGRARLRERRHLPGRPGDLRAPRRRGGRDRDRARRPQHQRRLRRHRTPSALAERVKDSDAEIGFAFDGDGDRLIAVDGEGRVHDGDELIALAARHLKAAGRARRRGRGHGDDQLRLPPGAGAPRASRSPRPRSETAT